LDFARRCDLIPPDLDSTEALIEEEKEFRQQFPGSGE